MDAVESKNELIAVWSRLIEDRGGRPAAADGVGYLWADSTFAFWNTLTLTEPQHPDLVFRRVETEDDLETYGEINALAYDMPPQVGRAALAGSKLWLDEAYAYLGYRDGEPVTCAATIPSDGTLFLALVATLPGHRDQGYGEAITRKAIFEGARATGRRRVVLHATPAGRPVYERIGLGANTPVHFVQLAGALDEVGD